jgi:hypothetical protein
VVVTPATNVLVRRPAARAHAAYREEAAGMRVTVGRLLRPAAHPLRVSPDRSRRGL